MPQLRVVVLVVALVSALPMIGEPQTTPAPGRPVRTVIASGRIASLAESPVTFRLLRVTLPAGQSVTYGGPDGMLYVLSGAGIVSVDGDKRPVRDGAAIFTPAGQPATLSATSGGAIFLHFLVGPLADMDGAPYGTASGVAELYRGRERLPNLKPGVHEFTMVRVSVDKNVPRPPMHHRSGAALYYVLGGTWTIHMENGSEPRSRGNIQAEPNGFVHTWENVGDTTGLLLQANISAEGTPEITFMPQR